MSDKEDELFKQLSNVTLKQTWEETKGTFFAWLVLSVFIYVLEVTMKFGEAATSEFFNMLPKPVWFMIGFAIWTWILRGEEFAIKFYFPKKIGLWIVVNLISIAIIISSIILPNWAVISLILAVLCLGSALDSLAKLGKENIENNSKIQSINSSQ